MNRMKRTWIAVLVAALAACSGRSKSAPAGGGAKPVFSAARGFVDGLVDGDELLVIVKTDREVAIGQGAHSAPVDDVAGGELRAKLDGEEQEIPLPLKRTDVKARISLHVGSVRVVQSYHNPYDKKIEAVYVFPLPQNAAISDFIMQIGDRRIRGIIREREEAKRIYLAARRQGYVASLLTQERPNIFTQAVANIEPGKSIEIEIAYFHTLKYSDGEYEFVFPMVVGPRFNPPGSTDGVGAVSRDKVGTSGQATEVPYLRPNEISAHMISMRIDVDAGPHMRDLRSPSHSIDVRKAKGGSSRVTLKEHDTIPNRDFVLRWRVTESEVYGAVATHRDEQGGYFTMMLQPPRRLSDLPRSKREMIFVVDCSGSMSGEPIAACKRAMRRCLKRLDEDDTFMIIRFSNETSQLGPRPLRATPSNVKSGLRYVDRLDADGGTMMKRGVVAALSMPQEADRYRVVSFMTDGFIGNEREILGAVHEHLGRARIFSFGVGSSVNRYLLERMASVGRGVAAYIGTGESSERAVDGLYRRLEQPALTDIEVDWGAMDVRDVHPEPLPDLFVGRPVILAGRFSGTGRVTVKVKGRLGGKPHEIRIPVDLDDPAARHEALAKVWARAQIASWHDRMAYAATPDELADLIRDTALTYGLVSDYTAFLAVDSSRRTEGSGGTTVPVPVPVPQGVRYDTAVND